MTDEMIKLSEALQGIWGHDLPDLTPGDDHIRNEAYDAWQQEGDDDHPAEETEPASFQRPDGIQLRSVMRYHPGTEEPSHVTEVWEIARRDPDAVATEAEGMGWSIWVVGSAGNDDTPVVVVYRECKWPELHDRHR